MHWVALYINMKCNTIEVYDSSGEYDEELKILKSFITKIQ